MKRKIIKQGHNTLTITLPTNWARRFNLESGRDVDVFERDNNLLISAEKIDDSCRKVEINLQGLDIPTIWKTFMSVYREGYDEVHVKFSPEEKFESPYKFFSHNKIDLKKGNSKKLKSPLEFLHSLVDRFIGYELIECKSNTAVIKDLTEPTSREFDNSIKRVLLLIDQMAEETFYALENKDPQSLSHIHDVDVNLDKFHDYCIRILNKREIKDSQKSSLYFATLYLLELMGDEFKNISHHYIYDFPKSDFKNIIHITKSIKEQLDLFYEVFYKFNFEKVSRISEIDKKRYFEVGKVYKKIKEDDEKEIFHHLRIITRYINSLVELRIEMEF